MGELGMWTALKRKELIELTILLGYKIRCLPERSKLLGHSSIENSSAVLDRDSALKTKGSNIGIDYFGRK